MGFQKKSNIKCILAYCGTQYLGWQKTRVGPSIEGVVEEALGKILQHPVMLQAASRTDRGVHAEGQVINFFSYPQPLKKLQQSLNALFPKDISSLSLEEAEESFHPTLDCRGKEYHYHICNCSFQSPFYQAFSWHYRIPLDLELMRQAASLLIGERDFSAFTNQRLPVEKAHRRVTRIAFHTLPDQRLRIEIEGASFLYKMVRNLVGTLVYIGSQKISLSMLPQILLSRDRRLAGMTAPAHGLCLKKVFYLPIS